MKRNIFVFLFSLITLILAKDIKLNDDVSEIISLDSNVKSPGEIVLLDTYGAPPPQSTFDHSSQTKYANSLTALRNLVSIAAGDIKNVQKTKPKQKGLYSIAAYKDDVHLVIQNSDLYVVGFVNTYKEQRTFWRFKDHSKVTIDGPQQAITLDIKSDYTSLAGTALNKVKITKKNLDKALTVLRDFKNDKGSQTELGQMLLGLIISTSEATRFRVIEVNIGKILDNYNVYTVGPDGETTLKNWSKYSEETLKMEKNNAHSFSISFKVQCNGKETNTFKKADVSCLMAVALNPASKNIMDPLRDYSSDVYPAEPGKDVVRELILDRSRY